MQQGSWHQWQQGSAAYLPGWRSPAQVPRSAEPVSQLLRLRLQYRQQSASVSWLTAFAPLSATGLGNTLQSDVYVGVARGTLDPDLIDDLTALEGITAYSTSRRAWLETAAGKTRLVALHMAPGSYAGIHVRDGDPTEVWQKFDSEQAVLVSDAYAYKHAVRPGDAIELDTRAGPHEFTVRRRLPKL